MIQKVQKIFRVPK